MLKEYTHGTNLSNHIMIFFGVLFILSTNHIISQNNSLGNKPFLGEEPPGLVPKIFAQDIISTNEGYEFGIAFSEDNQEIFYGVRIDDDWNAEIHHLKVENKKWSVPVRLQLDKTYSYNDPLIKGNRLYFISNRALDGKGKPKDSDIWFVEKKNNDWSDPINVGRNINSSKNEFYTSISDNGSLYFVSNMHTTDSTEWDYDVYYSSFLEDKYQKPVRMSKNINSTHFECDPYIAPDESYMIFCSSRSGGFGQGDLYISFKNEKNDWTSAINMGKVINSDSHEFCPVVTKDGKYFFYTSKGDIYWVSTYILTKLKNNE